jgi:hypothetical protein
VRTLVGEIDFSFHALNPSGTSSGASSDASSTKTGEQRKVEYTHQERTVQSIVDSDAIVSQVGLNERKGTCIPSIAPRPSTLTIYLSEGWKKG